MTLSHTDTDRPYGFFSPPPVIAGLITLAQHCPHNWLGKQLALFLRKLVLLTYRHPLDASVGPVRMRFYLADNISERKFLFLPWLSDQKERDLIARELPAGGVFVDIGANAGIYSLWACQYLSEPGTVIAIEPNPVMYARLEFNIQATLGTRLDRPRILTLALAISDREGILDLNLVRSDFGSGSVVRHTESTEKIQVITRPLLPVLSKYDIQRIDILKADIEGAEDIALRPFLESAQETLLPRYMIIENSEQLQQSELISVIRQRCYTVAFNTRMNIIYRHAGQ